MASESDIAKAVSNIVVDLEHEPATLAQFLIDMESNQYKKWQIFKIEIGKIVEDRFKGRATPTRKSKGCGGMETVFGKINGEERINLFGGQIQLQGLTTIQKVKKILESTNNKDVQKDLLADVLN